MASPPSKRQKRRIVVSSDEDENADASVEYRDFPTVLNGPPPKVHVRLASQRNSTNIRLPTRSRTKQRTVPTSRSATPATPASTNSSSEDPPRKPKRVQEARKRGSLHAYFNAANRVPQHKKEVQPKIENPCLDAEEEDLIEDDSLDEELRQVPSGKYVGTSTMGPRGGPVLPSTKRAASSGPEKPLSGSQKFLRAHRASGKDVLGQAIGIDRRVDLRPWAEKYAPTGLGELMVHKKKVADVRMWMERAFQGRERKVSLPISQLGH